MDSTIAAIATAYGEGGIGIVRISGQKAEEILQDIFIAKNKTVENRKLVYGEIIDPETNESLDEVMAVFMKAPKTYTKEDVVEINCHGGIVSLKKVLDLVLKRGAELAEKGEFTKRAFLNGRIDLSQAEAVIDIIKAKTTKSYNVARSQLEGDLSRKIKEIREGLLEALINIAVNIDYPDEDIEEIVYKNLDTDLGVEKEKIEKLLRTASAGKIVREGVKVAIVGKPNVGKSSLMNGLLKETRAIVTEVPGTTRDTILEQVNIRDIPIQLVDTAGIRETEDLVEKIGIEKSKETFNEADLALMVIDGNQLLTQEDLEIAAMLQGRAAIVLVNKSDLTQKIEMEEIKKILPETEILRTSFLNKKGIKELEEAIEEKVFSGKVQQQESLMVTNARHENLLRKSLQSLAEGLVIIRAEEPLEFVEVDIKAAYDSLGEIIGETVSEDIINEVFARFCLGK